MAGGQGCSSPDRLPRGERGESRGAKPLWARAKPAQVLGHLYFWPFGLLTKLALLDSRNPSPFQRTVGPAESGTEGRSRNLSPFQRKRMNEPRSSKSEACRRFFFLKNVLPFTFRPTVCLYHLPKNGCFSPAIYYYAYNIYRKKIS
jgi:hypothetical protein